MTASTWVSAPLFLHEFRTPTIITLDFRVRAIIFATQKFRTLHDIIKIMPFFFSLFMEIWTRAMKCRRKNAQSNLSQSICGHFCSRKRNTSAWVAAVINALRHNEVVFPFIALMCAIKAWTPAARTHFPAFLAFLPAAPTKLGSRGDSIAMNGQMDGGSE